jgi:splicing factor U2AF 35 kDa subunit
VEITFITQLVIDSYYLPFLCKMSRYQRDRDQPRGGAEHLARIHGTEEDRVNCPFYFKIGACRHGDKCSRQHHRPPFSETIIIKHMWNNPLCSIASSGGDLKSVDRSQLQNNLDEFYDEIFEELMKFGKVDDVQVCENLGDHMVGNVYVKFGDEEEAEAAKQALHGRYYAGRTLDVEYCPVTDFKEARCRQFDEGTCKRGPYCNFMHVCEPSNALRRYLQKVKAHAVICCNLCAPHRCCMLCW